MLIVLLVPSYHRWDNNGDACDDIVDPPVSKRRRGRQRNTRSNSSISDFCGKGKGASCGNWSWKQAR